MYIFFLIEQQVYFDLVSILSTFYINSDFWLAYMDSNSNQVTFLLTHWEELV